MRKLLIFSIWLITLVGCACYFFSLKGPTKGAIALSLLFSAIPFFGQCIAFVGFCVILWGWE